MALYCYCCLPCWSIQGVDVWNQLEVSEGGGRAFAVVVSLSLSVSRAIERGCGCLRIWRRES